MRRTLQVYSESWPLREVFTISRGSKRTAEVVVVEIREDDCLGRAECVPNARYGQSTASVIEEIETLRTDVLAGLNRSELQSVLSPGAARNGLDCALWDLEAKRLDHRVWELIGLPRPQPVTTAYTLSLDTADSMAEAARRNAHRAVLKVKLGARDVPEAIAAVRREAPNASLIVDANEAWTPEQLVGWMPTLRQAAVQLIEQPLPAGEDEVLGELDRLVPIAADESCHVAADVERLRGHYDVVNVKLDKAGGLTEAFGLLRAAQKAKLGVMIGCMVGTSLAIAPAMLLTCGARFVDLDGPLLLQGDRPGGIEVTNSKLCPPRVELWG